MSTPIEPGIHDLTFEEYLALPALSRSSLKILAQETPADFLFHQEHGTEETKPMQFGSAAHCALLEPERFETDYASFPHRVNNRATHTYEDEETGEVVWGKTDRDKFIASMKAAGRIILPQEELDKAREIAKEVRSRKAVQMLFAGGHAERCVIWRDPETGTLCKAKPDWWDVERGVYVDLKNTADLSDQFLGKSIINHGIDLQFAMLAEACKALGLPVPNTNVVLWARTTGRIDCRAEQLGEDVLARGARLYREALDLHAECERTGDYPGEPTTIQTRGLPRWATFEEEKAEEAAA